MTRANTTKHQLLAILKEPRVKRLAAEAITIRLAQAIEERTAAHIRGEPLACEPGLDVELLEALLVAIEGAA